MLGVACYNRPMKSIVVANWKMNPASARDAKKLFEASRKAAERAPHAVLVVAPPAIFFRELKNSYKGKRVAFAAQHARAEAGGAYTGETSLAQYKDASASYVIIGHAERRAMGESDEDAGRKVATALALKMTPILCVGEKEREGSGAHFDTVRTQLRLGLVGVEPAQLSRTIITYEPLWTIGKTEAMRPRDMHEMAIFIRKTIVDLKGPKGMDIKILYGGSIDDTNAADMRMNGDVHGFLVGRASEDAVKLDALLQALEGAA
jgi:triosephosphate isomerase